MWVFFIKIGANKNIKDGYTICINTTTLRQTFHVKTEQKHMNGHITSSSLSVRSAWISQLYIAMWNSSSWDLCARPSICSNYERANIISLLQITYAAVARKEHQLSPLLTHMSCSFFVTEHVGVGGHDRRPGLLRDAGGLRGSFALVHQLLHGVWDALVTRKSGAERGEVKNVGDIWPKEP